jgi:hypothetical protein
MDKYYEDNLKIKNIIDNNNRFFIGRIPEIEVNVLYQYNKLKKVSDNSLKILENNAGIKIIGEESLKEYTEEYLTAYKLCTGICIWDGQMYSTNKLGQDYVCEETPNIPKINAIGLEPYYFLHKEHWMQSIKNKRILIISQFIKSIEKQVNKGLNNILGQEWFEGCSFIYVKAPLTLAGNHNGKDWQEYFKLLVQDINKNQEFDIAMVSCGGYGIPVCKYIYSELNKSVMYIGGALQLFFGIIGRRWFTNKDILALTNDEWIRPDKSEKPDNFTNVEKGCYW